MSLLALVQRFTRRTNIDYPTSVIGSTDEQILQVLGLLEEEGNDLTGRGQWEALTFEATHTTVATESQGVMSTIASNGFRYIKNDTFWDRTENLPIIVIDGVEWAAEKGFVATAARFRARIRGGELLATPTPSAGNTWAFEYATWNWLTDSGGTTYKQYFTDDTDLMLLPESILEMGLRWRWKKEKGFEYAEDFRTYEILVKDALSRQGLKRTLHMDGSVGETRPGVVSQREGGV